MPELTAIPVSYSDEVKAVAKVDDFGLLDYSAKRAPAEPMEAPNAMLADAVGAASKAGRAADPAAEPATADDISEVRTGWTTSRSR